MSESLVEASEPLVNVDGEDAESLLIMARRSRCVTLLLDVIHLYLGERRAFDLLHLLERAVNEWLFSDESILWEYLIVLQSFVFFRDKSIDLDFSITEIPEDHLKQLADLAHSLPPLKTDSLRELYQSVMGKPLLNFETFTKMYAAFELYACLRGENPNLEKTVSPDSSLFEYAQRLHGLNAQIFSPQESDTPAARENLKRSHKNLIAFERSSSTFSEPVRILRVFSSMDRFARAFSDDNEVILSFLHYLLESSKAGQVFNESPLFCQMYLETWPDAPLWAECDFPNQAACMCISLASSFSHRDPAFLVLFSQWSQSIPCLCGDEVFAAREVAFKHHFRRFQTRLDKELDPNIREEASLILGQYLQIHRRSPEFPNIVDDYFLIFRGHNFVYQAKAELHKTGANPRIGSETLKLGIVVHLDILKRADSGNLYNQLFSDIEMLLSESLKMLIGIGNQMLLRQDGYALFTNVLKHLPFKESLDKKTPRGALIFKVISILQKRVDFVATWENDVIGTARLDNGLARWRLMFDKQKIEQRRLETEKKKKNWNFLPLASHTAPPVGESYEEISRHLTIDGRNDFLHLTKRVEPIEAFRRGLFSDSRPQVKQRPSEKPVTVTTTTAKEGAIPKSLLDFLTIVPFSEQLPRYKEGLEYLVSVSLKTTFPPANSF